jgi:hypothetical protein
MIQAQKFEEVKVGSVFVKGIFYCKEPNDKSKRVKGSIIIRFFEKGRRIVSSVSFFVGEEILDRFNLWTLTEVECKFEKNIVEGILRGDDDIVLDAADILLRRIASSDPDLKLGVLSVVYDEEIKRAEVVA